jgi:hypothetical protein
MTCHVFGTEHSLKQMPGPTNAKAGVCLRRHKVRKHFVFSSVSWHFTKCRCLLLLVSVNFSAVQGCSLLLVRESISELILMGRTLREFTACHGKRQEHIHRHKTCTVGDPGYFCQYRNSLRAGRSEDRIPVRARYSSSVQSGLGAHPAPTR